MPIGLNNTDIQVDYGGGNVFNVDVPKYLLTTTTEVSDEEIPNVNKSVLTRTQYVYGSDVTSGLVAHYKFDGDLTNIVTGSSINAVSGGTNDISYSQNKISGTSSIETHTNKFIKLNNFNPYNIWSSGSGISFAMWIKMDNLSSYVYANRNQRIFSIASVSNSGDTTSPNRTHQFGIWRTQYEPTRTLSFYYSDGTSTGSYQSSAFLTDSTWFHIVWSINSNGNWAISIDGLNQNVNVTLSLTNNPHELVFIGGDIANLSGAAYPIYFDDFRIYNKALSATEITNLYNLGAVNIEEGDISGTNDKYIAYKYIGGNDNGSGQSEYNLHFNNPALCDILVVGGGGAGGGNGQGGGGGAGALIYYEDIILQGDYTIKVGNGGTNGNAANVGDSGSDSEFKRTSDGKQQFLAKGGGGGGTSNSAGYLPGNGGSGGGGAGDSTSGTIIDEANIVNGIVINVINTNVNVVEHYDITMFSGDRGVDSLNDVGCFGNNGGIEQFGGHNDWGAGGGGAGSKGKPTSESAAIQYAGDGGSGKKYNITGTEVYYAAGGGGGIKPDTNSLNTAQVGTGGLGGGGAGGGGGTADSAVDSNGVDAEPHTGSGGGGVGAMTAANYKGGDGGSGIVIVRYKNENFSNDAYIPQGDNASEYTILDSDSTNLIAHYKFDEGEEYTDSASGVYNLIDLGKTSLFSTDKKVFGKSAHESGSEAKIQFPDSIASQISEISSMTGITFSFWFNMNTSSGAWASLFEFSDTTSDTTSTNRIGISKNNTANSIWIGIKEDNVTTSMTCGVVDDEWHHIIWSIDNRGTWQVYFDGVNQYPNKYKQIPQIYNYNYSYLFGNVQSSQTDGYIDDFRIYNKVLNPLEIHYLANKSIKLVPKEIDSEYNLLTFLYHNDLNSEDTLVYDFGAQSITNSASFAAYANTIPGITGVETFNTWNTSNSGGVGAYDATQGNPQVHGTIKIPLPNEYNHIKVEYAQVYASANATINLYVDTYANLMTSAVKSSITNYNARTFEYSYSNGDYLMIEDPIGSEGILGNKLRITFLKRQSYYNLTFDNPTECDFLIVGGGGGTGGTNNYFGGGGAGGLVFEQAVTLSSAVIKVGDGGKSSSNGVSSLVSYSSGITRTAFGGGGGGYTNLYSRTPYNGNDGGSGGGGSGRDGTHPGGISYHASNAPDGLGYGNNGGQGSGTGGQANNAGGGGGGAGAAGTNGSNGNAGDGGDGLSGIGNIDFKTHFALSTNNYIGEYIASEDKVYFAGGGGGGLHVNFTNGSGHFGDGGKGGGAGYLSDHGNKEVTLPGLPNSGGGGTGTSDIGKGGSGIVLVKYKRNMGTPTITTTTELAQWKYSATNVNVAHMGNVGIGTFPLTNYNLNVKGDISTNNLYKDGCLIGTGKIKEPDFISTPNVSSTYITGTSYNYITFVYDSNNDNGSNQTEYTFDVLSDMQCDILVVAGGGGGGGTDAGGGGAGGLIYETGLTLNGTYTIKVGKGGIGGAGGVNVGNNPGLKGKNSQIQGGNTIINYDAVGGGGGGSGYPNDLEPNPAGGGSSGGLGTSDISRDPANVHVDGQGYSGGIGVASGAGGGGGGGAGGAGGDGLSAVGGVGREIAITGTPTYYSGGGGGGHSPNKDGGLGGGGRGSQGGNGLDATFYGGGGGGGGGSWGAGGDGYEGIVIIRYDTTSLTYKLKEWKYSNTSTISYFMGNVGIGVTNPSLELEVDGTILKKAGINFKIQHPLNHNKWLYHTGLEGPRYDNIYRGKKVISGGYGEINIDTDCNSVGGMSSGTFVALNNNPFLYLRNNQTFDNVIGYIDNGIIKVNCENTSDDIEVEWMVIGERKDNAIKRSQLTDNQGRLLCERQL